MPNLEADNTEVKYTKEEPTATSHDEFSAPHSVKEEPDFNLPFSAEDANMIADVGVDKCVKLEPELVGIKEEPTNDSINEDQKLPVNIKEEPEVNFPFVGVFGQTSCWSPSSVKEELIDNISAEELDVDPLGSCSDTEKNVASECSNLKKKFLVMRRVLEKEKPYMCDVCGSEFGRRQDLVRHKRIHTGDTPHVCGICGKGFSDSGTLKKHTRTHTGEKPHVCGICGKGFSRSGNLKKHMRTHTGEKPHVCDICGKGFSQSGNLKLHMRTHTGEKPHVCDICYLGFSRHDTLKDHMRTHTGERPHICDICGLKFSLMNALKRHLKTHTGEIGTSCL